MKAELTRNLQYEYWIDFGEPEDARVIIPGDTEEEAAENYKKFIQHILTAASHALFQEEYDSRKPAQDVAESTKPKPRIKKKPKGNTAGISKGQKTRAKILKLLKKGKHTEAEIASSLNMDKTGIGVHLRKMLKDNKLIRKGSRPFAYYVNQPYYRPYEGMVKPDKDNEYMQKQQAELKGKKQKCPYCQTNDMESGEDLCSECQQMLSQRTKHLAEKARKKK